MFSEFMLFATIATFVPNDDLGDLPPAFADACRNVFDDLVVALTELRFDTLLEDLQLHVSAVSSALCENFSYSVVGNMLFLK